MGKVVNISKSKKSNAEKEVIVNIDRFPHLKNIRLSIGKLQEYIDLLEKRKTFAQKDYLSLDERQKVEVDILCIETDTKISRSRQRIDERQQYFNEYHKRLTDTYDEVSRNFENTRKEAILKSNDKAFHNSKALKNELNEANNFAGHFQTNWELKFRHYLELKKLLTASPAADQKDLKDVDVKISTGE
jgi:hypothetical protein